MAEKCRRFGRLELKPVRHEIVDLEGIFGLLAREQNQIDDLTLVDRTWLERFAVLGSLRRHLFPLFREEMQIACQCFRDAGIEVS